MESYNLPEESTTDNILPQTPPLRSWKDLLHEILAPTGPTDVSDEMDDEDE